MSAEEKILKTLFGDAKNEIRYVHGNKKKIVDVLFARKATNKVLSHLWQSSASLVDSINTLDILTSLGLSINAGKYVYFNEHIYVDCFAPAWPGETLARSMEILIQNLLKEPEEWDPFIMSLIVSITRKCVYRCEHCYAVETLGDKDIVSLDKLLEIARAFRNKGVAVYSWEGGEPLLRFDDLLTLIRETRDYGESIVATTAYGLTQEKARQLKEAGLVSTIISLDHYDPDKHNAFRRNKKSFDMAVNGVRIFRENGILPSIAICATREIVDNDELYRYLELAREIGAAFVQVIDPMPCGNYLKKDVILSKSQLEKIKKFHFIANTDPGYADYPSVQSRALLEDENLFGCAAGNALCYVDSTGNFQSCVMLPISLGNVLEEDVETVYNRMREYFPRCTRGRCPSQALQKKIATQYDKTGSLPLPYKDCEEILEKIQQQGLPDQFQKVSDKQKRKRLRDFVLP